MSIRNDSARNRTAGACAKVLYKQRTTSSTYLYLLRPTSCAAVVPSRRTPLDEALCTRHRSRGRDRPHFCLRPLRTHPSICCTTKAPGPSKNSPNFQRIRALVKKVVPNEPTISLSLHDMPHCSGAHCSGVQTKGQARDSPIVRHSLEVTAGRYLTSSELRQLEELAVAGG